MKFILLFHVVYFLLASVPFASAKSLDLHDDGDKTLTEETQVCPSKDMDAVFESDMSAMLLQTSLQHKRAHTSIQKGEDVQHAKKNRGDAQCLEDIGYDVNGLWRTENGASPLELAEVFGTPGKIKKVYYINLDKSTERRDFMESQLNQSSILYERFPAVPGADIEAGMYDHILGNRSVCERMYQGLEGKNINSTVANGLGDFVSHILIYEKILQQDNITDDMYLVLEDDAVLPSGWEDHMREHVIQNVPPDWTAVEVGIWDWIWPRCSDFVNDITLLTTHPAETLTRWGQNAPSYFGSAAILVTPRRLPIVLEEMSRQEPCHCDMNHLSSGKMRTYAFWPPYTGVEHDELESDRVVNFEQAAQQQKMLQKDSK